MPFSCLTYNDRTFWSVWSAKNKSPPLSLGSRPIVALARYWPINIDASCFSFGTIGFHDGIPYRAWFWKHERCSRLHLHEVGDKFGESLGGSQAPPSFWKVPGLPRKFPQLPRKFFGDFPGSSLTVEFNSNPGVPRKFPRLPRKFPELPRRFPGLPRRSAPFSGKPDTLSWLAKTSSDEVDVERPKNGYS